MLATEKENGIELTQFGRPRAYADSVYAGIVVAKSEAEAREKLVKMRYGDKIFDKQDKVHWSAPYFTEFKKIEEGKWKFQIVEEYTG